MKRLCVVIFIILSLTMMLYTTVPAATKVLRLSHQWAQGDIRDQWARKWASFVEEKTKGSIKFEIYPAASLFKAKAQFDAMRRGALDVCVLHHIYLTGKIPAMAITSMPCLVRSSAQGARWSKHEIGRRLEELCVKNGFRTVSWGSIMGGIGSKKRPIIVPEDMKGMKMRGAGKAMEQMMHAGGAAITSMPSTEVYFALQTGSLDALTTTYSSYISFRLYEVLDYFTVSKEYNVFNTHVGILVANRTWNRLTESEQKAIIEAGKETEPYFLKLSEGVIDKCINIYREKGVKIHYMTKDEFQKWLDLAKRSAYKIFCEKVKGGRELLNLALQVK